MTLFQMNMKTVICLIVELALGDSLLRNPVFSFIE